MDTMRVMVPIPIRASRIITVVDDFVTTGAMLLACASLVRAAIPSSAVLCLGLVRRLETVSELLTPCAGVIAYDAITGDTWREP
jgi:predicted phosphoribosyltransferase